MELKILLTITCISILAACGGSTDPKTLFTEKIGTTKLKGIELKDNKDWFDQSYKVSNAESPYKSVSAVYEAEGSDTIEYRITEHKKESAAAEELEEIAKCGGFEYSAKDWKDSPLKDKSGKEVGKIKICRANPDFEGNGNYYFGFQKANRTYTVKNIHYQQNFEAIANFIKNLPAISGDLDFAFLDEVSADIAKNKGVSKESLSKLAPPEQITEKPYLKGKVYEISTEENKFIDDDLKAKNTREIGTILKVECGKGSQIGNYNADGQTVPAYTSNCKVTIIDYTIPAVIAKKFFANATIPSSMTFGTKDGKIDSGKEVVAPVPWGDIKTWIAGLPKN